MKLLTVEEVAIICRTSPNTVRYWESQRTGPDSIKVGRRRLFEEERVLEWIAQGRTIDAPRATGRDTARQGASA